MLSIKSEPPAFGRIVVRAQLRKVIFILDKNHVRLPGELVDFLSNNLDTLTEVAASKRFTHYFTSIFERDFAELRKPVFPGSFVEKTFMEYQPLRKGGHIMWIDIHHAKPIACGFVLSVRHTKRENKA